MFEGVVTLDEALSGFADAVEEGRYFYAVLYARLAEARLVESRRSYDDVDRPDWDEQQDWFWNAEEPPDGYPYWPQ